MPRGGSRKGAGAKPKWNHGKTTVIRVPHALAEEILSFAQKLDQRTALELDTKSKVIDLQGVLVPTINSKRFVFLQDVLRLGYEIYPLELAQQVRQEINLHKSS